MGESVYPLALLIAQAVQSSGQTASPANSSDLRGVVITATVALIVGLGGIMTGFFTGLKWLSDNYQTQVSTLENIYKANVQNLEKSYLNERRSLELLLRQKESDIKNLKSRIKRMEGFYAIYFPDLEKGNSVLEKLQIFLKHIENKVRDKDENLSLEVRKMEDYIEGQLGLVDRTQFRFEAAKWITDHFDSLTKETIDYLLDESPNASSEEVKKAVENYIKTLRFMLRSGFDPNSKLRDKVKANCNAKYVKALSFIKDYKIGGQINHHAYSEMQEYIDSLIEIINNS